MLPHSRSIACLLLSGICCAQSNRPIGNQQAFITPDLERAVNKGHDYLASQQDPRGFWAQDIGFKHRNDYNVTGHAGHVGVTALALMSFLAGGHVPGRGKYGQVLTNGLEYVLECVRENGFIADNGSRMYSHAFATLLLAEVYGMTHRRDVRDALNRAITVIVDSQNSEGGWRYQLFARESDMSITVCQVMALRSARNVGVTVPRSTIERAENYVKASAGGNGRGSSRRSRFGYSYGGYVNSGGAFRYQKRGNSRSTFSLTAAGVTTLFAAGNYESSLIPPALEYLDGQLRMFNAQNGPNAGGHYFYYYGHYYAVQAFFVAGDPHWSKYFREVKKDLLGSQQADGRWLCEIGPGDVFGTAIATLVMQIPYQYLPIFQR